MPCSVFHSSWNCLKQKINQWNALIEGELVLEEVLGKEAQDNMWEYGVVLFATRSQVQFCSQRGERSLPAQSLFDCFSK